MVNNNNSDEVCVRIRSCSCVPNPVSLITYVIRRWCCCNHRSSRIITPFKTCPNGTYRYFKTDGNEELLAEQQFPYHGSITRTSVSGAPQFDPTQGTITDEAKCQTRVKKTKMCKRKAGTISNPEHERIIYLPPLRNGMDEDIIYGSGTRNAETVTEVMSIAIGRCAVSPELVGTYLKRIQSLNRILIKIDHDKILKDSSSTDQSDDSIASTKEFSLSSIYEIIQLAFKHPSVKELRVKVQNWRSSLGRETPIPLNEASISSKIQSDYVMKLNTLIVCCPGIPVDQLLVWRGFLVTQNSLEQLKCDFDSITWKFYVPILKIVSNTLKKLEIHSITNHNGNIENSCSFNWEILKDCKNLQTIKLSGDKRFYGLRNENMDKLAEHLDKLEDIELKYVDLDIDSIEALLLQFDNLQRISVKYFTPLPNIVFKKPLNDSDFTYVIARALRSKSIRLLSFADFKLPGIPSKRQSALEPVAFQYGYSSIWTKPNSPNQPTSLKIDFMQFVLQGKFQHD